MASRYQVVESAPPPPSRAYNAYTTREYTDSDDSDSDGYPRQPASRARSAATTRASGATRIVTHAVTHTSRRGRRTSEYTSSSSDDDYRSSIQQHKEAARFPSAVRKGSEHTATSYYPATSPYPQPSSYYPGAPLQSAPGVPGLSARPPPPPVELDYAPPPTEYAVDSIPAIYSFVPSRVGSSSTSVGGGKSPDGESLQAADPENGSSGLLDHSLRGRQILESKYTGDGVGGNHSAKLTIPPPSEATSDAHQNLFRWIHFHQQSLDFDAFSRQALQVAGLSSNEKKALEDLIHRIRSGMVKSIPTAKGGCVLHMEPAFTQFSIPPDGNHSRDEMAHAKFVSWVCLPYFALESYSGLLASVGPKSYPIETLLQAKFSRTTRERDMQQAVRQLEGAPPGFCFHVSQLWCFVVDNSVLLTCGRMAEDDLCGELIVKSHVVTEATSSCPKSQSKILVRYLSDVVWALPAADCETWFAFISQFKEFYPRNLVFFQNKSQVTADQWPKIWAMGMRTNQLVLDLKIGFLPAPTRSGVLLPIKKTIPSHETVNTPLHDAGPSASQEPPTQKQPSGDNGVVPEMAIADPLLPESLKKRKVHFMPHKKESHQQKAKESTAFAVFTCLDGVQASGGSIVDESVLRALFSEMDDFLQNNTAESDREAYSDCLECSRTDVHATLELERIEEELAGLNSRKDPKDPKRDRTHGYKRYPDKRQSYQTRVDLFNTADRVFKSFFPPDIEVPTVRKFWGAVHDLVQPRSPDENVDNTDGPPGDGDYYAKHTQARLTLGTLERIAAYLAPFSALFIHAEASDRTKIHTPVSFMNVWMNMVLGLACLRTNTYRLETLVDMGTEQLLREGIREMLESLSSKELSERSVVLPLELVSLMSMQLLKDVTPSLPPGSAARLPGIYETYSSYLDSIESDMTAKPPDRNHQVRIGRLDQEISVIQRTIDWQSSIFDAMEKAMQVANKPATRPSRPFSSRPGHLPPRHAHLPPPPMPPPPPGLSGYPTPGARSTATLPPTHTLPDREMHRHGFRELFLHEIKNYLASKAGDFEGLRSYAFGLDEANTTKLATNKDRQERAIYAFTIVTVIFLPLSSVASIFGINTADVRDMEVGQWAYWATAIPVTVFVIFSGLLWTGELGNVAEWFKNVARSLRVRTTSGSGGGGRASWKRLDGDDGILHRIRRGRSSGWSSSREKEDWGTEVVNIIPRPRRRKTFVSTGSRHRY